MIITNGSVKWTHRQALDAVNASLRGVVGLLAAEEPETAAPAVVAARDMIAVLGGLAAGVDALEANVAELQRQLDAARADPPGMVPARVRRTLRGSDRLVNAIVESDEYVPASLLPPLAP